MRGLLIFLLVFLSFFLFGQGSKELRNPYDYERTLGLNAHSSGWGGGMRFGKKLSGMKVRYFEYEFLSMKHPKEVRTINQMYSDARSYVYGKLNSFSAFRIGAGLQDVLFVKSQRSSGVEVRYHLFGGFSAGLAKPVYLYIINYRSFADPVVSLERYNPDLHFSETIYGRAPFVKGVNETKIHPGIYLKLGMSFEYAPYSDEIRLLEVGVTADYFYKDIPIMAYTDNKSVFLGFYLAFNFGKRFNKQQ
jgi:hypothetical protein